MSSASPALPAGRVVTPLGALREALGAERVAALPGLPGVVTDGADRLFMVTDDVRSCCDAAVVFVGSSSVQGWRQQQASGQGGSAACGASRPKHEVFSGPCARSWRGRKGWRSLGDSLRVCALLSTPCRSCQARLSKHTKLWTLPSYPGPSRAIQSVSHQPPCPC